MQAYIVVENGDPYPNIFTTYEKAVAAVLEKNKEIIAENKAMEQEPGDTCDELDTKENVKGEMYLYIEKGIHIYIYRLPVV
jgi:hypothetical protein